MPKDIIGTDSMPKFRKKPVVVEAIKSELIRYWFSPQHSTRIPDWLYDALGAGTIFLTDDEPANESDTGLRIKTLEGEMIVSPDDWIIRGVNGELYPCKPDIFEKTYEKVDDSCNT